jgi:hypothetical protein
MVARMTTIAVSGQRYIGDLYSNPVTGHGGTRAVASIEDSSIFSLGYKYSP